MDLVWVGVTVRVVIAVVFAATVAGVSMLEHTLDCTPEGSSMNRPEMEPITALVFMVFVACLAVSAVLIPRSRR